jgi:hypothetical protein
MEAHPRARDGTRAGSPGSKLAGRVRACGSWLSGEIAFLDCLQVPLRDARFRSDLSDSQSLRLACGAQLCTDACCARKGRFDFVFCHCGAA